MRSYTPILFLPQIVRAVVAEGRAGAYVLGSGSDFKVGYVGRSDTCIQHRLATHNYLYRFDYFIFRYAASIEEAYLFECEAFHALDQNGGTILNKYHPAAPHSSSMSCPYCDFAADIRQALLAA